MITTAAARPETAQERAKGKGKHEMMHGEASELSKEKRESVWEGAGEGGTARTEGERD